MTIGPVIDNGGAAHSLEVITVSCGGVVVAGQIYRADLTKFTDTLVLHGLQTWCLLVVAAT